MPTIYKSKNPTAVFAPHMGIDFQCPANKLTMKLSMLAGFQC